GPGHVLGAERGAFQRIDSDVDLGTFAGADLLADEQHRRLVELPLPDYDGAVDRQVVEVAAHGVDGGLVGRLLGRAPAPAGCRYGRALGHAHDLERQYPLDQQVRLNRNRCVGLAVPFFHALTSYITPDPVPRNTRLYRRVQYPPSRVEMHHFGA